MGQILVAMGLCTSDQVSEAAVGQEESPDETMLGMLLVSMGALSKEQLDLALETQEGLRSGSIRKRAMAQAAIAQKSGETTSNMAILLETKSEELKRHSTEVHKKITTGSGHPAVTDAMLDKRG